MTNLHVLVIDDEQAQRQMLAAAVGKAGYSVETASGVIEATAKLARADIDVALCDIIMPDGNGIDLLRQHRATGGETAFVMITAMASLESAVEALRLGAEDYIVKPVRHQEVLHRLAQIKALRELSEENRILRKVVKDASAPRFTFSSPHMQEVDRLARKVAPTDSTVLITGESGTGKGMLARTLHELSGRRNNAFVAVNCSAIPDQLLESEFFGHTKGAFTGAATARKGLFLEADKGSLFLDEIGELPLPMQTKLLHAIEEKQVRAVGSELTRHVDIRIIAATNRDLEESVRQGEFREDLYFRLSMFQIALPPLRERQSDIQKLIHFFMESDRRGITSPRMTIDPEAEAYLLAYNWPGNVRELDNVINRAHILAENNCITVADLPNSLINSTCIASTIEQVLDCECNLRRQVHNYEVELIQTTIKAAQGDRHLAAQRLGISLSSLYRKLEGTETI